jgi:N-acetylglucosamine-6-phosphate deacetylase
MPPACSPPPVGSTSRSTAVYGLDFTQNPASIWEVATRLAQTGTTSFLPTIITSPLETVSRAMQVVKAGPPRGWKGAHPLGIHAEGPFLNPGKKGAHDPARMRHPEPGLLETWTFKDGLRLVTLAPELPGGLEAVRILRAQGVSVSIGHSLATYEEAQQAFAAGVSSVTHLYNASRRSTIAIPAWQPPRCSIRMCAWG